MALMCVAIRSPAWFKDKLEGKIPWTCMWCQELGTNEHVSWECKGAVHELGKRPEPTDQWQNKYGWPTGRTERKKEDERVIDWMEQIANNMEVKDIGAQRGKGLCRQRGRREGRGENNEKKMKIGKRLMIGWIVGWSIGKTQKETMNIMKLRVKKTATSKRFEPLELHRCSASLS